MPTQATGGRNGGGRGKYRQANKQLSESLREACPPHKLGDLEGLVKEYKGDEVKIREKISEWWEEPSQQPTEGEWENVNKKGTIIKEKSNNLQPRAGRGDGRGRGRGGGREGRGRGRNGETGRGDVKRNEQKSNSNRTESVNGRLHGTPPVESVRIPQGPWTMKAETIAPSVEAAETIDEEADTGEFVDAAVIEAVPAAPKPVSAVRAGNVWATKGSAHLIEAEKPKPPPPSVPSAQQPTTITSQGTRSTHVAPISRTTTKDPSPKLAPIQRSTPQSPAPELATNISGISLIDQEQAIINLPSQSAEPEPMLETGTSNAWASGLGSSDSLDPTSNTVGIGAISVPSSSINSLPMPNLSEASPPAPVASVLPKPEPKLVAPTSFMNMGHWENEDNDDANLDFGFGTFDAPSANEPTTSTDATNASPSMVPENNLVASQSSAANASPARPPPGLSIGGGGMPPMPPNAVLVHELENKLEQVSIESNAKQTNSANDKTSGSIQQQNPNQLSHDFSGQVPNPYGSGNQYGAMGVGYGYGGGGVNPFVGMPGPGAPVLSTPQQAPPAKPLQQTGGPLSQTGGSGLYGSQATSTGPATSVGANTSDVAPPTSSGLPPAMASSGMPYGNVYYGQQPPFHMGHNQNNLGYNYYGTQFAGVQGFGYPQNLGQNTGYGHGPYHDDAAGTHGHQAQASTGGYQQQPKNNSGVYRGGRNNHSHHANSNQYQGYNPQQHLQGGYGGQPYGMGYHGEHFNQRGGYGGMQDPYGMQPQPPQGGGSYGFQSDDQYNKGKNKGARGGGIQNFQPAGGPPPHISGQQGFGLQGQVGTDTAQSNAGGWSNQQASGWGSGVGGGSGWQQK